MAHSAGEKRFPQGFYDAVATGGDAPFFGDVGANLIDKRGKIRRDIRDLCGWYVIHKSFDFI